MEKLTNIENSDTKKLKKQISRQHCKCFIQIEELSLSKVFEQQRLFGALSGTKM